MLSQSSVFFEKFPRPETKRHFLYADLHDRSSMREWRAMLEKSGLKIVRELDITGNVLRALITTMIAS